MNNKTFIKDTALVGLMVAFIEAAKFVMAGIPNVELTSFLLIMFSLFLGKRIYFAIPVFILIEGAVYGFGLWWIMYLYAWPLLALITWFVRKKDSVLLYSIISGMFGLCFGALCSIPYLFIGGPAMMFNWWIAGIPFDLIHGPSNFIIMLLLYKPMRRIMDRLSTEEQF